MSTISPDYQRSVTATATSPTVNHAGLKLTPDLRSVTLTGMASPTVSHAALKIDPDLRQVTLAGMPSPVRSNPAFVLKLGYHRTLPLPGVANIDYRNLATINGGFIYPRQRPNQ